MPAICFDNVWKIYKSGMKKAPVLSGLSLEINDGEIFGFLGPNGAGKSTAIKLLLNFIQLSKGKITVNNLDVSKNNFQKYIGYLPEMPCFYENLTGAEILLFAGKASGIDKDQTQKRSLKVLERMNLIKAEKMPVRNYSKGMKQRLGVALALIHDPQIYILDEPMSGLDPFGRMLMKEVLLELKQRGKTVFFSSHILSDAETLCDRIGILNKGKLLFAGTISECIRQHNNLEHAFISLIKQDLGGYSG